MDSIKQDEEVAQATGGAHNTLEPAGRSIWEPDSPSEIRLEDIQASLRKTSGAELVTLPSPYSFNHPAERERQMIMQQERILHQAVLKNSSTEGDCSAKSSPANSIESSIASILDRLDRIEHSNGSIVSRIEAMEKIIVPSSGGASDEHLVREERESETSVGFSSACGGSPAAGNGNPSGLQPRSRTESAPHED